ncbi:UNVERIFIED_CONTAM: Retrovirus-related Pol polyprotein from transposon opus [Sesamum indicum]
MDRDITFFITDGGIYCYNVMTFSLKNTSATYQRLVNKMFSELIGKTMEVYMDDMLVKSKRSDNHLEHLKQAFAIMRAYGMKLNPDKCTFGVSGGKFLGYMVCERGIEANPEKIEAIMGLRSPTTIKEVQKLTGKITSINHFISRSADRSLPFFKVLRKTKDFTWVEECERALQDFAGSQKLSHETPASEGIQNPVYYVSKMLQGAEKRYSEMVKLELALVIVARKLRPYFQSHKIIVLTNYPLKYVLLQPEASGRLVKWVVELGEYDIDYQTKVAQKEQVLVDFMIELTGNPTKESNNKWMLHVDGPSNASNGGAGIWMQGPEGVEIKVEYEALILGLELAYEVGARNLEVFTDSQLFFFFFFLGKCNFH